MDLRTNARSQRKRRAYEGVDLDQARRNGALLGVIGVLVSAPFLALVPPTARIGSAGWVVTGVVGVAAMLGAAQALRNRSFEQGIALAYLGLIEIAAVEWLAGGYESPYHELYVLPLVYVAAVHPAGRLAVFTLVTMAMAALPLAYDGWSARAAGTILTQDLVWLGLVVVSYRLMTRVRAQRIQLRRRGDEAREDARLDVLTGLGNRRAFDEVLERELSRQGRTGGSLTIAIGDVDGFKGINDVFGHVKGDECLRRVGTAIAEEVRRPDACFRWGGDEFVVIMPDTDRAAAELVTERLAEAVKDECAWVEGASLSMTFGFAEASEGATPAGLVESADRELMTNKPERSIH